MRLLLVPIFAVVFLSGCSVASQADAVRRDVDHGRVAGMSEADRFSYSFPRAHAGPYTEIQDLHVRIEQGDHQGKNATFFMGKSRETGEWEIFGTMVQSDDGWQAISVSQKPQEPLSQSE